MPMSLDPDQGTNRGARGLKAIGRLRPGVSLSQAQAQMDLIAAQITREFPNAGTDEAIALVPIDQDSVRYAGYSGKPQALVIVLAITVSVLLIACLHIASLLIARSAAREREIAVRAALGAHRLRLVRQLLTESILLAGSGALLGLLFAYWGFAVLSPFRGQYIPWYGDSAPGRLIPWFTQVHINGRVLLYMVVVSLLTCALFGTLPAIGASAVHLNRSLSTGRAQIAGPRFQSLRTLLVVGDIAIAVVLLTGAGLMVNSYVRIVNIDPGYNPTDVLSLDVVLNEEKPPYSAPEQRLAFFEEITRRVHALPGVRLAAAASSSPVDGTGNVRPFKIEGMTYDAGRFRIQGLDDMLPDSSYMWFPYWQVFPDYFRVVQIPLLKGRHFTEQDTATSQPVVMISEALARIFWPNGNPVGQYLIQAPPRGGSTPIASEIVGVVGGAKHFGRSEPSDPEVYVPYCQAGCSGWMTLLVRTDSTHKDVASAVRQEILKVDPDVMIGGVTLMDRDISGFWSGQRSLMFCLAVFAAVGLVLACLGVYGATAYAVSRRTHEIGIRMALGARSSDVLRAILRQGLRLTLIGLAIGLAGALAATRVIRSLLYDVSATDPLTFACVALLLARVTLLACYLPARRAARIDPMVALRYE
jgi:putative ABC transport system permease protein